MTSSIRADQRAFPHLRTAICICLLACAGAFTSPASAGLFPWPPPTPTPAPTPTPPPGGGGSGQLVELASTSAVAPSQTPALAPAPVSQYDVNNQQYSKNEFPARDTNARHARYVRRAGRGTGSRLNRMNLSGAQVAPYHSDQPLRAGVAAPLQQPARAATASLETSVLDRQTQSQNGIE